jgi:dihydroorotate dehydrogenase (fumarate)
MNLKTNYLGLELEHPLVASAGPLTQDIGHMRSLEDAGASAVVMPSLFEEQILLEAETLHHHLSHPAESFPEALSYLPEHVDYNAAPEHYLEIIRRAKEAVHIPVIASLNGFSTGGWSDYARKIEEAGADALELNIYFVPAELERTGREVEQTYVDIVREVRGKVTMPIAVKVSPYFSSIGNMAQRLVKAGANGLVLFNRFYQPDIDLEALEVTPNLRLSTSFTSRLSMRWIAILYGRLQASLAATGGVHDHEDVLKLLMVGADVTMMTSALLLNGIYHIGKVRQDMIHWMEEHGYSSVGQMKGSMSQRSYSDPSAFERASYIKVLESYKVVHAYRAG